MQSDLREKLGKIEQLFCGAGTPGERRAAEAASARLRAKLAEIERSDRPIEVQISIDDQWSRQLFVALCRRYGLKPYRYAQQPTTVAVRAPRRFVNEVLWRQFRSIDGELRAYLTDVTRKVIRDEICADTSDALEILAALPAA
jgi:hypothetical protein